MSKKKKESPEQVEARKRIARLDQIAETLGKLIESETVSEMQKGRLFAQLLDWEKIRLTLVPSDQGGGLKGMQDELAQGSGRNGSGRSPQAKSDNLDIGIDTRRASHKDGSAIRSIIASLPSSHGRNQGDIEREGVGNHSDGRGAAIDRDSDDSRDVDGARNISVV